MSILSFGYYIDGKPYKVLDERRMRASAGIMMLLGTIAAINGFEECNMCSGKGHKTWKFPCDNCKQSGQVDCP